MDEDARLHNSKSLIPIANCYEPVYTLNKRPFCIENFELRNFKRVGRKQHILSTTLGMYQYRFVKFSVLAATL
jgi:hypothetical protein